jgi:uncharacterized protein DUF4339
MYKILGTDQKEYGPVTADQIRAWINEGRANSVTRVQAEGSTDWKPLSEFPEFADALRGTPPPMSAAFPTSSTTAAERVNGPAIGLMAVAIIGFVMQAAGLAMHLAGVGFATAGQRNDVVARMFSGGIGVLSAIVGMAVSGLILFGALKMKKLESHGLAMAASILAMVPCISPCCLLGLPFGIWALMVLTKPEIKDAFQ